MNEWMDWRVEENPVNTFNCTSQSFLNAFFIWDERLRKVT